jgi:hypothetical protein
MILKQNNFTILQLVHIDFVEKNALASCIKVENDKTTVLTLWNFDVICEEKCRIICKPYKQVFEPPVRKIFNVNNTNFQTEKTQKMTNTH